MDSALLAGIVVASVVGLIIVGTVIVRFKKTRAVPVRPVEKRISTPAEAVIESVLGTTTKTASIATKAESHSAKAKTLRALPPPATQTKAASLGSFSSMPAPTKKRAASQPAASFPEPAPPELKTARKPTHAKVARPKKRAAFQFQP